MHIIKYANVVDSVLVVIYICLVPNLSASLQNSFGYVVEGADFLSDVKEGDIITSAKVTQGIENFKKGAE